MDLTHAPSDGKQYDQDPTNDAAADLAIFVLQSQEFHRIKIKHAFQMLVKAIDTKHSNKIVWIL